MTAIKCIGVKSASFGGLQRYIERGGKFLGRRTLNVADEAHWAREMDEVAAIEGVPGRTGTRGYHIILGFRPDEVIARRPDGSVDEGRVAWCLDYAEEFCARTMPGLQCAMGAHLETSDADGSERVAVHVVASRPVLSEFAYPDRADHVARPGTLYDRSPSVTRAQVACVRALDAEAGLSQLRRGRNVSDRRARGRTGAEREMLARGAMPWKEEMRRALVACVGASASMGELERTMRERGFRLDLARSRNNITVRDGAGHRARVSTLGVTRERIEEILAARAEVTGLARRAFPRGAAPSRAPSGRTGCRLRIEERRVVIGSAHVTLLRVRLAVSVPPHLAGAPAAADAGLLRMARLAAAQRRALLGMKSREVERLRRAAARAAETGETLHLVRTRRSR